LAPRPTATRSALSGCTGNGYDPSHSRWYRGLTKLLFALTTVGGMAVEQHVTHLGVWLLRPDRQCVEAIFDTLKDRLTPERHGGWTRPRVHARVVQQLLALATAAWFNWQLGLKPTRSLVAYDH
jgi:hypothetical protein